MTETNRTFRTETHFGRVMRCYADRQPDGFAMLASGCQIAPDSLALVDGATRLSHRELHDNAARLAGGLADLGLRAGDRVAMMISNRAAFIEMLLACFRSGLIAVPISTRSQAPEIEYLIKDSGAAALFYDEALSDVLPEEGALPPHSISVDSDPYEHLRNGLSQPPSPGAEDDIAVILYTSGTTGSPKGATLTHLNVVHSCRHFSDGMKLTREDRSLLAVPASHVTGLVANILTILSVGGAVLILPNFEVDGFLRLAQAEGMTHTIMVPAMYNLILMRATLADWSLGRWRLGGFGGGPMPERTIARLAEALPDLSLLNAYGATETCSPATMIPLGITNRPDSVGRALPCADMLIMDEDGREVPPGETGEIWIAGPMVVPGYWRNEQKTTESFIHGHWRSGDVGSVDADGYYRILDRLKEMINRGGYKIYSAEVENVLAAHADIAEAAVVPVPDPILGERVRAVVCLERGATIDETALRAHCARFLSDYKRPEFFDFQTGPLPRNANGKVQKRALLDRDCP
ncbi:MAG: AMP-binding protein [Pseudomonadota bacterium]